MPQQRATRASTLLASALLLAQACSVPPTDLPAQAAPPDILLVVLDTVRADHTPSYGYATNTTAQLSAIAEAGVTFEDTTSPSSWTWPTHASLFTGVMPWEHGAHFSPEPSDEELSTGAVPFLPMRADLPTLAERLSEAGYRTVAVSTNSLLDPSLGLTRGFHQATVHDTDGKTVEAVQAILEAAGDQPLFLMVNLNGAHAPWQVTPAPWSERHAAQLQPDTAPAWVRPYLLDSTLGVDLYRSPGTGPSAIYHYMAGRLTIPPDWLALLGDLYDGQLVAVDLALRSVVVAWQNKRRHFVMAVTADHGEYFGEHGMLEHGHTLYSQVTQVPLVLAAPGRLPAGLRIPEPVQMHDLHPTLLELAGLEPAPPCSLLRVIEGQPRCGPVMAAAWRCWSVAAFMDGPFDQNWNLYREGDDALLLAGDGRRELYDLGTDPEMLLDLATLQPELADRLTASALEAIPAQEQHPPQSPLQVDPAILERLEALGYVKD